MPDDTTDAEIAEQNAMDDFNADDDNTGKTDDEKDSKNDDSGQEKEDEKDSGDDEGNKKDDDDDEPLTPKQIAEMRAGIKDKDGKKGKTNNPLINDLFGDAEEDDENQDGDQTDKKDDEEKSKGKDKSLDPDDDEFDLDEYKKAYPEDYAAIYKIASQMVEKMGGGKNNDTQYVSKDDFDSAIAEMTLSLEVTRLHPDAEAVTAIDDEGNLIDKQFASWINEQPKAIQRLFVVGDKDIGTAAEDFIAGMDYYKDSIKEKKASEHDKQARENKKKKDALHKNTMRMKASTKSKSGETEDDEEAEAKEIFEKG